MSSSSSSSSAVKKKQQDEQNLKFLRELVALLPNKQCFDCHQRGPTYVNVTIGSFVCTSCSGILRGLNPPHRVKSISMATFTADEIEFLKSRGNEYCRRVWLGRYDRGGRSPLEDGVSKDDNAMKDYLALKYEKKRWYLNPTEAFASSPPPVQKIPSSSSSSNNNNNVANSNAMQQHQSSAAATAAAHRSQSSGGAPISIQNPPPPSSTAAAQSRPSPQQPPPPPTSQGDLFARNPTASTVHQQPTSADILFDPFGTSAGFGSSFSSPSGSTIHQHQSPPASSNGLFQGGLQGADNGGVGVPKSATVPAGFLGAGGGAAGQLQPTMATNQQQHHMQQQQQQQQAQAQPVKSMGDRYSALAELDDLFRSTSPVDANLGAAANHRHPAPAPVGGGGGGFPPMSNQFYQPRPPNSSISPANPFASPPTTTAPSSASNFFGNNGAGNQSAGGGGFGGGFFPTGPSAMQHQHQQQQQHQQFRQQFQSPAQMAPMNPFAGPSPGNAPRPTAAGAPSWNPFL